MTFGDEQDEVLRRLEESGSDPAFWTREEVKESLNDGWEELALHAEWFHAESQFQVQDGITYYDLRDWSPLEVIKVRAIWNETLQRWLVPSAFEELETMYRRWESSESAVQRFFLRGNFTLGVFGKPTVSSLAYTADMLTVLTCAVPPPLLPSDYVIPHPEEFCEAEILYALYDLKAQEGETKLSLGFWKQYIAKADEMKAWARKTVTSAIVKGLRETN